MRRVLDFLQRVLDYVRRLPWRSFWKKMRWLAARAAILMGSLLVVMLVMVACAGWYTSRPVFCNSCHIMEPYYKSWQESSHSDVSCIECHFAPGLGGKLRGKMLGLVQLAKYVTASSAPRPSAEIPDASCLRSGCHETRLLSGVVEFHTERGTVPFNHTPHLGVLRRGKQLRCTSCHSQIVQGKHMTVTPTTCFLCHFKGQAFNADLGACNKCHEIPKRQFDLGGGVMFNHEQAKQKGVDCATCHGDVIRGKGEVPRERCLSCHNREGDLDQIGDHVFMHTKHVSDHKVDCLQCHLRIEHSLDKEKVVHAAANCQSCHPDHHREQTDMLRGIGGKTVSPHVAGMAPFRVECMSCHQKELKSTTGSVLWKGTLSKTCSLCHDEAKVKQFETDHMQLRASLPEIEAAIARLPAALKAAELPADRRAELAAELKDVQHDVDFLRVGNDVHNMHYATKLNQALVERVSALCSKLNVAGPKLPPPKTSEK